MAASAELRPLLIFFGCGGFRRDMVTEVGYFHTLRRSENATENGICDRAGRGDRP